MPSSVIHYYKYNAESRILRVEFVSGLVYEYRSVPKKIYEQMNASPSKGKFLNEFIKGKYPFEKIDPVS